MGNRTPDMDPNDPGETSVPQHSRPPPLPSRLHKAHVVPPQVPPSYRVSAGASAANAVARANYMARQAYRRSPVGYVPSTVGPGAYNNYPYNRSYTSVGGVVNPYVSSYNSYGHTINQYQNPVVVAAAESSRPAFESIQSVVQSFNAVSMMLESTLAAMQMSFDSLLGVAENFTRLRTFMMRLYSTIVSFKLARWFLTKLLYLLKMVRGQGGSRPEEELWASLSSTMQGELVSPSDGRSWPLVVFTGLLFATPYFVYKLLNSVTPVSDTSPSNQANHLPSNYTNAQSRAPRGLDIHFRAKSDWSSVNELTLPLTRGKDYWTSSKRLAASHDNGGWLLVNDEHGQKGYVPAALFGHPNNNPRISLNPDMVPENVVLQTIPEQVFIIDEHDNQVPLPHPSVMVLDDDDDKPNESML